MPWPVGPPDTRIKLDDLATPDDNLNLNTTILRHGLAPKLSGKASDFLNGLGKWSQAGALSSPTDVVDSLFNIRDDITPGKVAQFQYAGLPAGVNVFTFPAVSAATLAVLELAQTFLRPQVIDPLLTTDVPLTLVGQAGQTSNLFQVKDSTGAVLTGINAAGDIVGGALVASTLVLLSTDFAGSSVARVVLTSAPGVEFDAPGGSIKPLVLAIGLASGTLTGTALLIRLIGASGQNGTMVIDNRGWATTPVPLTIYRATTGAGANLTEWRDEQAGGASVIMSRIRSDGAFIGGIVGTQVAPYVAKTGMYTVVATDGIINCTSGTFTVTLLTAVGIAGQQFVIKNSGSGIITVATTSAQTIDGQTTQTVKPSSAMAVCSDGANWIIV